MGASAANVIGPHVPEARGARSRGAGICDAWPAPSFMGRRNQPQQDITMSKGLNQKKDKKKAPTKTADEKRAAKREKKKLK